ncbi:hypothetical protein LEP1GSC088_1591 [Leptospira interrogans str. L1207]|nr:hypothetical protein LEP1GSC088_1591 [Leptospira interrogans str. L1207]
MRKPTDFKRKRIIQTQTITTSQKDTNRTSSPIHKFNFIILKYKKPL